MKETKKNENKILYTIIGIVINSVVNIGINKLFYSNEVMISLIGYKKTWQMQHLKMNFVYATVVALIYSIIMFNKKDFEKKEIWKSIICIIFLIVVPALVSYIILYTNN